MTADKCEGKLVGKWPLAGSWVELRWNPKEPGGSFVCWPDDQGLPLITVGNPSRRNWEHVAGVLVHEAVEMTMTVFGFRWKPSMDLAGSHAGYTFLMDHEQFTAVAADAGHFLAEALPALKAAAFPVKRKRK